LSQHDRGGFSIQWFLISLGVMAALTGAVVFGLPMAIPSLLDFEGSAGMLIAIPIWFLGGVLIGMVSPDRTFTEPTVATVIVAIPTAFFLFSGQTVKTIPYWLYIALSVIGILFSLVGAYAGERFQLGHRAHS